MSEGSYRALVVTASNRAAAGVYEDKGGPLIADGLKRFGFAVEGPQVVADGRPVEAALQAAVDAGYRALVVTASNRAAAGVYEDKGGPLVAEGLRRLSLIHI